MNHLQNSEFECPKWGIVLGLLSTATSFIFCTYVHGLIESYLRGHVSNWIALLAIEYLLLPSYVVPIAAGMLLMSTRYRVLQALGALLGGVGLGVAIRLALLLFGVMCPFPST
jgi:hypothetical protein